MFGYLRPIALLSYLIGWPILIFEFTRTFARGNSTLLKISFFLVVLGLISSLVAGWKFRLQLRHPYLFMTGNALLVFGTIIVIILAKFTENNFVEIWLLFFFGAIAGAIMASITAFMWNETY